MKLDKDAALEAILGPAQDKKGMSADALSLLADELIEAVNQKDSKAVAQALRSSFLQFNSEPPHEDGPIEEK